MIGVLLCAAALPPGVFPLSWTIAPSCDGCWPRPPKEMISYALGEFKRIPPYAAVHGFCSPSPDFSPALLAILEHALDEQEQH